MSRYPEADIYDCNLKIIDEKGFYEYAANKPFEDGELYAAARHDAYKEMEAYLGGDWGEYDGDFYISGCIRYIPEAWASLAKYLEGSITFIGDDLSIWRDTFKDGKALSEEASSISFPSDGKDIWYEENWTLEDLADAIEKNGLEATPERIERLKASCEGIFDDKSGRMEMLENAAEIVFYQEFSGPEDAER